MEHRVILGLVVLMFVFVGQSVCKGGEGCILLGEKYQIGETKHPKLEDPNSNYCVTCKCNPRPNNGKPHLNCTSERCPTSCTDPTFKQCCNICSGDRKSMNREDSGNFSSSHADALYAPDPMSPPHQRDDAASPSNNPLVAGLSSIKNSFNSPCQSDGTTYKHGTPIQGKQPNDKPRSKCNQCICNNGQVQCKWRMCPQIKCTNPIRSVSDCCYRCPGSFPADNWSVTFPEKDTKDCPSGDRYYRNGATWHPIIGPFGEMSCVLCKCLAGRIECSRLKCRKKLSCAKPAKVTGQCCPVCPSQQYEGNTRLSERSDLKNCLSSRAEVAVYKAEGGGMSSLVVQFAFIPLMVDYSNVEIRHHQIMTIKKNFENFRPLTIDLKNFDNLRSKFSFVLLGGTTKKQMTKFEKRMDRRWRKCKRLNALHKGMNRSQPCTVHMNKLMSILKFKEVQRKDVCGGGEIQVQI